MCVCVHAHTFYSMYMHICEHMYTYICNLSLTVNGVSLHLFMSEQYSCLENPMDGGAL